MSYEDSNDEKKVIWNMDDEILKIIQELKRCFLRSLMDWNLEDTYWYLDLICTECDAKFTPKEQADIENKLKILEKLRQTSKNNGHKGAGEFYKELRNLYKEINRLMVSHGVWFRESDDDSGL